MAEVNILIRDDYSWNAVCDAFCEDGRSPVPGLNVLFLVKGYFVGKSCLQQIHFQLMTLAGKASKIGRRRKL